MPNYKPQDKKIIYLNTDAGCTKELSADTLKVLSYNWDINNLKIDDIAHLSVGNMQAQGTGDGGNILTFRLNNVDFITRNYFSTNNFSSPILLATTVNSAGIANATNITLTINPQILRRITIIPSDTLADPTAGVSVNLKFIFCLIIEEFDIKLTQIGNPYGESRMNALNNKLY